METLPLPNSMMDAQQAGQQHAGTEVQAGFAQGGDSCSESAADEDGPCEMHHGITRCVGRLKEARMPREAMQKLRKAQVHPAPGPPRALRQVQTKLDKNRQQHSV